MKKRNTGTQFAGLDSTQSMYLEESLTYLKRKVLESPLPELKLLRKIPISMDTPAGAETIKQAVYDLIGSAKIIADGATDIPRVDVSLSEVDIPVRVVADSFVITLRNIENGLLSGMPITDKKQRAAIRMMDVELNRILLEGDDKYGLVGILSNPYFPKIANPSGAPWTYNSDPEDILEDVHALIMTPFETTNSVEDIDTVLFPSIYWSILLKKKVGTLDNKTIITFLRETYPNVDFDFIPDLNSVRNPRTGGANCPVAFAFTANTEKISHEIPGGVRNQMLPTQPEGMDFKTIMRSLTGGILSSFPKSTLTMDFAA